MCMEPQSSAGNVARRTILLAEDDTMVRPVLVAFLSRQGYKVLEAGDGLEALELWESRRPEVGILLTDMMMPGMTGLELGKSLRISEPELPVIIVSGVHPADRRAQEMQDLGFQFVLKPYDGFKLCALIENSLQGWNPEIPDPPPRSRTSEPQQFELVNAGERQAWFII